MNQKNPSSWDVLKTRVKNDEHALALFEQLSVRLVEENKKYNLTALITRDDIINYHFLDSLALGLCRDLTQMRTFVDVGSGAGFPAIPLAIVYPHMHIIALEVHLKKAEFIEQMAAAFHLNVHVERLDFRTFLRTTSYQDVDLVGARASLQPAELLRMYKPACIYNGAELVYWASDDWRPQAGETPFFSRDCTYTVGNKKRKLIFFGLHKTNS